MNTRIYQAPIFDLLELDLAPEVFFTIQEKLQPVAAGTPVPVGYEMFFKNTLAR